MIRPRVRDGDLGALRERVNKRRERNQCNNEEGTLSKAFNDGRRYDRSHAKDEKECEHHSSVKGGGSGVWQV